MDVIDRVHEILNPNELKHHHNGGEDIDPEIKSEGVCFLYEASKNDFERENGHGDNVHKTEDKTGIDIEETLVDINGEYAIDGEHRHEEHIACRVE